MTERLSPGALWLAALACLLAGVLFSVHACGRLRQTRDVLTRKHADLLALEALDARAREHTMALEAFEALAQKQPTPLAALLKTHLPSDTPDDIRESRDQAPQDWSLQRREVSFTEVPLPKLIRFVAAAESATNRPPWRLEKCVIRASARAAGYGQVQLVLQAFEKKDR